MAIAISLVSWFSQLGAFCESALHGFIESALHARGCGVSICDDAGACCYQGACIDHIQEPLCVSGGGRFLGIGMSCDHTPSGSTGQCDLPTSEEGACCRAIRQYYAGCDTGGSFTAGWDYIEYGSYIPYVPGANGTKGYCPTESSYERGAPDQGCPGEQWIVTFYPGEWYSYPQRCAPHHSDIGCNGAGACCEPWNTPSCHMAAANSLICSSGGGHWQGDNSCCYTQNCDTAYPCCLRRSGEDRCSMLSQNECLSLGGYSNVGETSCSSSNVQCPSACCLPCGCSDYVGSATCREKGGVWHEERNCNEVTC